MGVGMFWSTSIIGFCIASAATTATLSDQVPVNQRGFVSGWISAPQAIGTILGLTLVTTIWASISAEQAFGYPLVAILLIVLALPFIATLPDQQLRKDQRPRGGLGTMLQGFWINPVKHPDFGWTLLGRILVNLGNALGTTLLLYFLQYGLGLSAKGAINGLLFLTVVYLFFFVLAALVLRSHQRPDRTPQGLRLHLRLDPGDRGAGPGLRARLRCRRRRRRHCSASATAATWPSTRRSRRRCCRMRTRAAKTSAS